MKSSIAHLLRLLCFQALLLIPAAMSHAWTFPAEIMEQKVLRFYMDMTPGVGHQSHTATIMRRLREDGFKGRMDVVFFHDSVAEKLGLLFPNYNPKDTHVIQKDLANNIHFYHLSYSEMFDGPDLEDYPKVQEHVTYAISGGNDRGMTSWTDFLTKRLMADYLITLNPPGWGNQSHVLFPQGEVVQMPDLQNSSTSESNYTWKKNNPDEQEFDSGLVDRLEALRKTAIVIPAYPSSAKIERMLNKILAGLISKETAGKTVVVPIVGKMSDSGFVAFNEKNKSSKDQYTWTTLSQIENGKINFVLLDPLAPPTFSHIFTKMKFPIVILSGRNSVNIAVRAGQPFLASESASEKNYSVLNLKNEPHWKEFVAAEEALLNERADVAALRQYFSDALNGDSEMRTFFAKLSARTLLANPEDHLVLGFREAIKVIRLAKLKGPSSCSGYVVPVAPPPAYE
ncbi:MAG: hypothetical protein K2X47_12360 [Bdellovibrionales bacterium]|nr:hypothetical protein [Bdellovibrionales bacterium]